MTHISLHHTSSTTPLKALLLCILLTALSIYPFTSEAAEKEVEKTVKISDFSRISASSGIRINYTQGPATGTARVSVSSSMEKYLRVEVKDKCLKIYYDLNNINMKGNKFPTIVTVQSPALSKVQLSSASSLQMNGPLTMKSEVKVNLSSAARATFGQLTCSELDAELSSAATLKVNSLKGNLELNTSSAATAEFESATSAKTDLGSSSAASIKLSRLAGGNLKAGVSSGAKISVDDITCDVVSASASSGGVANLSGKCKSFSQSTSSGGKVTTNMLSSGNSVITSSKGQTINITSTENVSDMEGLRSQLSASRKSIEEQKAALEEQRKQLDIQRQELAEQRQQLAEQRRQLQIQKQKLSKSQKKKSAAKKKKTTGNSDSAYMANSNDNLRIP